MAERTAGGVVFVPGDPPRTGFLALWPPPSGKPTSPRQGGELELLLPAGTTVRRRRVPALFMPMADAVGWLADPPAPLAPAAAAWVSAARLGFDLISRGRLVPAASPGGWDAWRVGPLDAADLDRLAQLAAAFPPEAHAIPIAGSTPARIRSADSLVRDLWDALADALVRSPAAALTVADPAFASSDPVDVTDLAEWLATADRTLDSGARPGLRLEFPDGPGGELRATVQLRSTVDASLVVDAAHLWDAPAAVLARMGDVVDADLFLALRRGAQVWPPLKRLLDEARPESLVLDDTAAGDLLSGAVADGLAGAGIEVLWPAELGQDQLTLRAVVGPTPSPGSVTKAGLDLSSLVEFRWQVALGGQVLSHDELAQVAEAKRPVVRLRGRWVTVDPALLARLQRRRPPRMSGAEALAAALAGDVEVDGERVAVSADGPLADLAARLGAAAGTNRVGEAPLGLTATLRPYQLRGLAWLSEMAELGLGGCLADDMGLGKTVQVIALHLSRKGSAGGRSGARGTAGLPTLVVCPTSLLGNWERELGRFAPEVPVRRFHGGGRHLEKVAPGEVVLVTYGVMRRDLESLRVIDWGLVVADEAQHAKNPLSSTARALRGLPAQARIALTGTPVENRLSELWSILDWTTPGLLGPLDRFRRQVAVPVERGGDPEITERLARTVRPFLLRRRKSDPGIAPELPPKTETDVVVPLTVEQTTLYEAVVRETMAQVEMAEGMARRGLVLKLLTALKQVCNHPAQYLRQRTPLAGRSGKLAALDELVDVIVDEGESVLVFTQYVQMAALIESHLGGRGVSSMLLQGKVSAANREKMVASFQAGEVAVFLLSLKAGGVGLNLTRATHVIHYDRWWNPAVEDQASDRAYRIGQDRPVQIHRLVTEGTLEDRIAALLASKRELADRVVGAGEGWISELSNDDLSALVSLGSAR
ncbi:MAG TPA: DEAD/DEAH box helicase [Acidimicrobiales bacterium]|nr:DEAD/DEAH box helicase [Acidimicrobiales bacterium]